jgi:hypothetical protein
MIIYNITTKITHTIEAPWLQWQQEEHIPEILQTTLFTEYKMFRLLEHDDAEGNTYVVQFTATSIENYQRYLNEFATSLRQKAFNKWGNQFISFRSLLEVIH